MHKKFSPVFVLLVQLALLNVFYSKWCLEDIIFYTSLSVLWIFLPAPFSYSFWKKFFDRSRFFKSVFTLITSQCEYERSKIKLFYALFVNFSQLMVFYSLSFCECTFSLINEIFWKNSQLLWKQVFIARYLFSKINVKVKTKSQSIWYVIQMLQSL